MDLLQFSLNDLGWVALGVVLWLAAYLVVDHPRDALGLVLNLLLGLLPLLAGVVLLSIAVHRWDTQRYIAIAAVVLSVGAAYLLLKHFRVFAMAVKKQAEREPGRGGSVVTYAEILLAIAIQAGTLAALLVSGWQMIQGSPTVGLVLAGVTVVAIGVEFIPRAVWNPFREGRLKLRAFGEGQSGG